MITTTKSRTARTALLLAALAITGPLRSQGLSYDITTVGTMPDRSGNVSTRNMSSAHGQFSGGNSRLDFTESLAPVGMMASGTYMITNAAKGTVTSVDPAKHQYFVMDLAEMGKTATDMQAAMGGMAKTEIADIKVAMEDLGPGEPMDGYATYKYRLSQSWTMNMTVMGHTMSTPTSSVMDVWIAPALDGIMDPSSRPPVAATGMMAELTRQLVGQYGKMRKGLMLKRVSTSEGGSGARKHTTTMTTTITNVKKMVISPSVFAVPIDYKKVDMMEGMGVSTGAAQPAKPR